MLTTFDADFESIFFWNRKKTNAPVAKTPKRILNGNDAGTLNTSPPNDNSDFAVDAALFATISADFEKGAIGCV